MTSIILYITQLHMLHYILLTFEQFCRGGPGNLPRVSTYRNNNEYQFNMCGHAIADEVAQMQIA